MTCAATKLTTLRTTTKTTVTKMTMTNPVVAPLPVVAAAHKIVAREEALARPLDLVAAATQRADGSQPGVATVVLEWDWRLAGEPSS
jgi:carbohydrate-binding DOMON domain-containing protein